MKLYDRLTDELTHWIQQQHVFFVASAPLAADGHINLSPRGYDCFRILDDHRVAWLDLTGSGNETAAHVQENGRITIMFCAFQGAPQILRLFGQGETVLPDSDNWSALRAQFPEMPGERQIITVDIERIQTSCGYSVPFMSFEGEREGLVEWADRKGEEGIQAYQQSHNTRSIDGLPIRTRK